MNGTSPHARAEPKHLAVMCESESHNQHLANIFRRRSEIELGHGWHDIHLGVAETCSLSKRPMAMSLGSGRRKPSKPIISSVIDMAETRHCSSRRIGTGTRLMSLRLSHTMNAAGSRVSWLGVYTGMTHSCSQPRHTTLAAGRAFTRRFCDFMALIATAGQWFSSSPLISTAAPLLAPKRASNSQSASCGVIPRQAPLLQRSPVPQMVPLVRFRRRPTSRAASYPARRT